MPYVQRDNHNNILSITQNSGPDHKEYLSPTDAEIVSFLANSPEPDSAKATLSESDGNFTRATEDLIHLLIKKNIILFTELPPEVQIKMSAREKLRSNLNENPYNFLDDGESL